MKKERQPLGAWLSLSEPVSGGEGFCIITGEGEMSKKGRRSRARARARQWDRDNAPTSYRLDDELPDRVRAVVAWYKAAGYRVSQSTVVSALLWYALDAWEAGLVPVDCEPLVPEVQSLARNLE